MAARDFQHTVSKYVFSRIPRVFCKQCRGASEFPFKNALMTVRMYNIPRKALVDGVKVKFFCMDLGLKFKHDRHASLRFYVSNHEESKEIARNVEAIIDNWISDEYEIHIRYDYQTGSPLTEQ